MRTLAVDPGSTHSAYVVVDNGLTPIWFDKIPNHELLQLPHLETSKLVIEMIGHYGTGMPAGKDVFDTCIWIGRFIQANYANTGRPVELVLRKTVVTHICGSVKANDANVTQALVDRFTPGSRNYGKGTKGQPGWFYGFHRDIWAAYALAVYHQDANAAPT